MSNNKNRGGGGSLTWVGRAWGGAVALVSKIHVYNLS